MDILKKKTSPKLQLSYLQNIKNIIDEVHATLKALQGQVLDMGIVKPSVNVDIPVVDLLNDNERVETSVMLIQTVDNNGQIQSQITTI